MPLLIAGRLKVVLLFVKCCCNVADDTLRALRFPVRLPMLVTVPALFGATWFAYDPALSLYAWYTRPAPPVVVYDPPPSRPRVTALPPPPPAAPVVIGPPARDTVRQNPGHMVSSSPVDTAAAPASEIARQPPVIIARCRCVGDGRSKKSKRKIKQKRQSAQDTSFFPRNQYPDTTDPHIDLGPY